MKKKIRFISLVIALVFALNVAPYTSLSAGADSYNWVGSWSTSPVNLSLVVFNLFWEDITTANTSIRSTITPTLSGDVVRFKFSNLYGDEVLSISEATVAYTGDSDDEIDTSSLTQITFNNGSTSVNIAAGAEIYSDPIEFEVIALTKISITTYYKSSVTLSTVGLSGGVSYLAMGLGNRTHSENVSYFATKLTISSGEISYYTIPFLTNIDVQRTDDAYSVVIIGDSTVTNDSYLYLATKLISNGITNVGVLCQGIIGNRLLYGTYDSTLANTYGDPMMERFEHDALEQSGVKYIILKIGVNDIIHPLTESLSTNSPAVTVDEMIEAYKELAAMASDAGITCYLTTRTSFNGYTRSFLGNDDDFVFTDECEEFRLALNEWILSEGADYYDGIIDLSIMSDPDDTTRLRSQLTLDGAHLSSLGQIAFVDLIPNEAIGISSDVTLTSLSELIDVDPYTYTSSSSSSSSSDDSDDDSSSSLASTITASIQDGLSIAANAIIGLFTSDDDDDDDSTDSGSSSTDTDDTDDTDGTDDSDDTTSTILILNSSDDDDSTTTVSTETIISSLTSSTDTSTDTSTSSSTSTSDTDSTESTTSTSSTASSVRKLAGVLILCGVCILLVAVIMIVVANKNTGYSRDGLTRSVRKLRV